MSNIHSSFFHAGKPQMRSFHAHRLSKLIRNEKIRNDWRTERVNRVTQKEEEEEEGTNLTITGRRNNFKFCSLFFSS
jgi:stage III sporulation protein SpoIIIAA